MTRARVFNSDGVPRRTCRLLVALAVCMLPATHRARYAEEFSDELLELPHGEQLGYALRLLGRSWQLRYVLDDSLRNSRAPRPRRNPVLVPFAAAAVLVIIFSGASVGARAAEPGDRLWSLTKVLYTERAKSVEAEVEARDQLDQASDALAEGRPDEVESALAQVEDELRVVKAEESRTELDGKAEELRDELG